jgi:hypothetical protein
MREGFICLPVYRELRKKTKVKYMLVELNAFSMPFVVPSDVIEDVDIWIHEFTEVALGEAIDPLCSSTSFTFSVGGHRVCLTYIEHIMTSLCCISMLDGHRFEPEEYWKLLNTDREI